MLGYVGEELGLFERGQEDGAAALLAGKGGALGVAVDVVDLAAVFADEARHKLVGEGDQLAEGEGRAVMALGVPREGADAVLRPGGQLICAPP